MTAGGYIPDVCLDRFGSGGAQYFSGLAQSGDRVSGAVWFHHRAAGGAVWSLSLGDDHAAVGRQLQVGWLDSQLFCLLVDLLACLCRWDILWSWIPITILGHYVNSFILLKCRVKQIKYFLNAKTPVNVIQRH